MTIDQSEKSPFFDLLDNETDAELADFASARQVDTEKLREAVMKKNTELLKVLRICDEMEGKND